jgi:hypothetical protein
MSFSSPVVIEASDLRAVFEQRGDRWHHRLEVQWGNDWIEVLRSVEGSENEPWPPSPALQEIHIQYRPTDGPVVFGVGKSGRNHWSLSCQRCWRSQRELGFSYACRTRDEFQRVGNTYLVVPEAKFVTYGGLHAVGPQAGCWIQTQDHDSVAVGDDQRVRIDLFPSLKLPDRVVPETLRWNYTIQPTDSRILTKREG